jgi:hypothetical protein
MMFRLLRRLWDFDFLLWLAERYGYRYEYYKLFPPRHAAVQPDDGYGEIDPVVADYIVRSWHIRAAAVGLNDNRPIDEWRPYGSEADAS